MNALIFIGLLTISYSLGDEFHPKFHTFSQQKDFVESNEGIPYWKNMGMEEIKKAQEVRNKIIENKAKNIIIFVGDGMSLPTLTAARIYKAQMAVNFNGSVSGEETRLFFETFPHVGLSKTYSVNGQTPDSSATATAMFSGIKTISGTLGFDANIVESDADSVENATEVETILLHAQRAGKATGFVTSTRITHATPASLYAHSADRDWECDRHLDADGVTSVKSIAWQLMNREPGNMTKVILGGGKKTLMLKSENPDEYKDDDYATTEYTYNCYSNDKDYIEVFKNASVNNVFVENRTDLMNVDVTKTDRLMGLFSETHTIFDHERRSKSIPDIQDAPSLEDMTHKAIEMLSQSETGFFLMVEGGRIDHAHHNSWASTALDETTMLDKAVEMAFSMTNQEETLIIVTADHGHTMSIAGYQDRGSDVRGIVMEYGKPKMAADDLPYPILTYANGEGFENYTYVGEDGNVARVDLRTINMTDYYYKVSSSVPKGSETHSGADVGIFASGPFAHYFHGVHEQSFIYYVMAHSGCLGDFTNAEHCKTKDEPAGSSKVVPVTLMLFVITLLIH